MKKLLTLLLFGAVLHSATAQIFETYQGKLRRMAEKLSKDTSDIVLDPIEQVPQYSPQRFSAAGITNWGSDLLRPAAVVARIAAECNKPVTIKIADTGWKWDHADLQSGQLPGSNYTTDANAADANGHSTHVAGIIAGRDFGIAYPLITKGLLKIKPIQVLSSTGSGSFDWVRNAVASEREDDRQRLARGEGVIWSGSFGGGTALIANVEAELQKSTDLGILFVFAAGNTGTTGVNYPGNGKYSIAVGSLDQNLAVSSYSTRGPEVLVGAPGRAINSTYKGNTYAVLSGTSMATPCESAMLAIALSKWGNTYLKTVQQARNYLGWCAKDLPPAGRDNDTGFGLDYITAILDKNPKDAPGDTPPPPPDPTPPGHEPRYLTFQLGDGYDVYWSIVQGSSKSAEPTTYRATLSKAKALDLSKVTLTEIGVEVNSKKILSEEYKSTRTEVKGFFNNRAFGLMPGMDDADAAYWAAYFLEMILEQKGLFLDVLSVTGKDAAGNPIKWEKSRLKHWPIGSSDWPDKADWIILN